MHTSRGAGTGGFAAVVRDTAIKRSYFCAISGTRNSRRQRRCRTAARTANARSRVRPRRRLTAERQTNRAARSRTTIDTQRRITAATTVVNARRAR